MEYKLKKGRRELDISVPDEKVAGVLLGNDVTAMDLEEAKKSILTGIKNHAPEAIAGQKIAIIVPDDTRLWARGDIFVPHIVGALLDLGVVEEQIKIIIALGTHVDMAEKDFPQLVGSFGNAEIEILNSANTNQDRLGFLGKTTRNTEVYITKEAIEADHIIIFGGVLHHMFAGYGGGRKYIFPGIAGHDSIQQNHALALQQDGTSHPMVQPGILDGNPINEDITEAADIFLKEKTSTYVAVAANGAGQIFHCEVGPLHTTFVNSCKKLDQACCVDVSQKEDFALISAGGHRTDGQLYQATKALINAVHAVKKGGDILFVAECAQGAGNSVFASVLRDFQNDPSKIANELIKKFNTPAWVASNVGAILNRYRVTLVSNFDRSEVEEFGFHFTDDIENYIRRLRGRGYIMPFAENILPVIQA